MLRTMHSIRRAGATAGLVLGVALALAGCASVGAGITVPIGRAGGVGVTIGSDGRIGVGVGVGGAHGGVTIGGSADLPRRDDPPAPAEPAASAP